jgi:molecular chaperone Hsp33
MDCMLKMLAERTRIRLTKVDVTQTAKALEARHLCGPVAGRILAEGLAAVSLLSADSEAEEAVLLQVRVDGPVRGLVAEATGAGHLRGYTMEKILDGLDSEEPVVSEKGLGPAGKALVMRSLPGRLLGQTPMPFTPPDFRVLLARYYNLSLQVPAGVELAVRADSGGILSARALVAERMPDGRQADFVPLLEAFQDGRVKALLEADAPPAEFARLAGLADLAVRETRELRFQCRCSREKAAASFSSLTQPEIDEIVQAAKAQHVVCHLCGADYSIPAAEVAR